jgi:hypothetical protein
MPAKYDGAEELPENYEQYKEAGWPDLNRPNWQGKPAKDFANFLEAKPVELKPGQKIYRIIDELNYDAGAYWAYELPKNKTEWRRDYAVKDSWNDNGYYIEYTVKEGESIKVWGGKAAGQPYETHDGKKFYLPGGGIQLYIEPGTLNTPSPKLTNWSEG